MEKEKIKGAIESILFASGRPVTPRELELSLELDQDKIQEAITEMQQAYQKEDRGIELTKIETGYTLSSKTVYHNYIYGVIDKRAKLSLSQAALEVLAIIAYNPKITRAEIETIRGVGSDASIYRLLEHGLIKDAGKLDLPGKPVSYKVTEEFYKKFGITSQEDLPDLPKYKLDENRQIVIDDLIDGETEVKEEAQDKNQELEKQNEEEGEKIDKTDKRDNET